MLLFRGSRQRGGRDRLHIALIRLSRIGAALFVLGALLITVPGGAQAATDPACYGAQHAVTGESNPQINVVAFGLIYDCVAHGWQFSMTTSDKWPLSALSELTLFFNTDGNVGNGCNGFDRALLASASPSPHATVVVTPSCDNSSFLFAGQGVIVQPTPSQLVVQFTNNDLGNPSSFTWFGTVQGTADAQPERMPATGFLSEVGFPPVPVDNPCTTVVAGGVTQRVARMDDARATAAAVTALRAAGMRDVVTPVAGVVRFGGDDRRAAAVLGGAGVAADVSTDRVAAYATVPNDPGYAAQWNLPLINAPEAWSITHGSSAVVVADLDSGVDATQPDLQGKLVPGFDVAQRAPLPNTNTDDTGHGTAVAGLIAATPDNGIELAGVGWSTRVAEVKMSNPPTIGDIVAGIQWAAGQRIPIINLSLGGCSDPTEAAAVQAAQAGGSLIVASVGNDALDGNPREFPAAYPGVIGVGATAHDGSRALYSEVGPQVALVAPGGSADGNPSDDLPVLAPGGGTTTAAGTSFAAPQVAGAAALILGADPSLTPDDAGQLLVATASPVGPSAEFGHGRLDMQAGLLAAARLARVAGPDRYATSVALVQSGWNAIPRPPVYLASGANFPDALSAGVVAGINGAPILLTDTCALPAGTAAELRALNPSAVYLIGGTAAICDAVAAAVAQVLGFPPGRIAGADRYVTNAQVVATAFPSQVSTAYVTTGANFPDGLTGSPRAAKDGAPLLLTDTCALPPAVAAQLGRLQPTLVKVLGGTSAVCPAVLDQIVKATGGAAVDRIAGATRVDTGVLVAQDGWSQSTSALVASAGNFPDALSAGALATLDHAPLLINDTCAADPSVASELRSLGVSQVTVVGGSAALCGAAVAPLGAAIR